MKESSEQKVKELAHQLANVNLELDSLLYGVSHDLRAPLSAISGFSYLLQKKYDDSLDEPAKEYIAQITDACGRMNHMIEDLVKLSRISRFELARTTLNLSNIANVAAKKIAAENSDCKVRVCIQDNIYVEADEKLVTIILENILDNAFKFSRSKANPLIVLGEKIESGQHIFFVEDNGVGFDMSYSSKLFAPFQRLHSQTDYSGSGIGLAIVARIIHRHGGDIWAEAEVDKGATFYFTLN